MNTPAPETHAFLEAMPFGTSYPMSLLNFARKLERERDGLSVMHKAEMKMRMEAQRERDEARKERNELNNLLRLVGWGQGEIDSAAAIAEENDVLIAERDRLQHENQLLCEFINREVKMTAADPRIKEIVESKATELNQLRRQVEMDTERITRIQNHGYKNEVELEQLRKVCDAIADETQSMISYCEGDITYSVTDIRLLKARCYENLKRLNSLPHVIAAKKGEQ